MKENMLTRNWVYDIIKVLKVSICGWILNIFWMFLYFSLFGGPERSSTLQLKKTPGNRKTLQKIKKKNHKHNRSVFVNTKMWQNTCKSDTDEPSTSFQSVSVTVSSHFLPLLSLTRPFIVSPGALLFCCIIFFFFFWLKKIILLCFGCFCRTSALVLSGSPYKPECEF